MLPAPLLVGMGTHSPRIMDTSLLQQLLLLPQSYSPLHLDHCFCFIQKRTLEKQRHALFSYHPSAISHPSVISSKGDVSHLLLLIDSICSLLLTYIYIYIQHVCACVPVCRSYILNICTCIDLLFSVRRSFDEVSCSKDNNILLRLMMSRLH